MSQNLRRNTPINNGLYSKKSYFNSVQKSFASHVVCIALDQSLRDNGDQKTQRTSQGTCFQGAKPQVKWKWKLLSRVRLFPTLWTIQSVEFPRPEYWSRYLSLLQGIFPTQGSNPGLPHCRWILYQLRHKGSPRISQKVQGIGVGSLSLLQHIFRPRSWLGSPALQAGSSPTELSGKPRIQVKEVQITNSN